MRFRRESLGEIQGNLVRQPLRFPLPGGNGVGMGEKHGQAVVKRQGAPHLGRRGRRRELDSSRTPSEPPMTVSENRRLPPLDEQRVRAELVDSTTGFTGSLRFVPARGNPALASENSRTSALRNP